MWLSAFCQIIKVNCMKQKKLHKSILEKEMIKLNAELKFSHGRKIARHMMYTGWCFEAFCYLQILRSKCHRLISNAYMQKVIVASLPFVLFPVLLSFHDQSSSPYVYNTVCSNLHAMVIRYQATVVKMGWTWDNVRELGRRNVTSVIAVDCWSKFPASTATKFQATVDETWYWRERTWEEGWVRFVTACYCFGSLVNFTFTSYCPLPRQSCYKRGSTIRTGRERTDNMGGWIIVPFRDCCAWCCRAIFVYCQEYCRFNHGAGDKPIAR